jgi:hypothetical protein
MYIRQIFLLNFFVLQWKEVKCYKVINVEDIKCSFLNYEWKMKNEKPIRMIDIIISKKDY